MYRNKLADSRKFTYGEKAVGLSFNPSGDGRVDDVKRQYADIIDNLNAARAVAKDGETKRHFSVAITEAETAQMRAVKAYTFEPLSDPQSTGDGASDEMPTEEQDVE